MNIGPTQQLDPRTYVTKVKDQKMRQFVENNITAKDNHVALYESAKYQKTIEHDNHLRQVNRQKKNWEYARLQQQNIELAQLQNKKIVNQSAINQIKDGTMYSHMQKKRIEQHRRHSHYSYQGSVGKQSIMNKQEYHKQQLELKNQIILDKYKKQQTIKSSKDQHIQSLKQLEIQTLTSNYPLQNHSSEFNQYQAQKQQKDVEVYSQNQTNNRYSDVRKKIQINK